MQTRSVARLTALSLLAWGLSGCIPGYRPGGSQASQDQYTYPSTVDAPQSVRLVNTVTGETIWEADIPIGKQLVISFYENQKNGGTQGSIMRWELMEAGREGGDLVNAMPVPGPEARRLDPYLRPSPAAGAANEPISPLPAPRLPPEPTSGPH